MTKLEKYGTNQFIIGNPVKPALRTKQLKGIMRDDRRPCRGVERNSVEEMLKAWLASTVLRGIEMN